MCSWSGLSGDGAVGLAPLDPAEQVEREGPRQQGHGDEGGVQRVLHVLLELHIDRLAQLDLAEAGQGISVLTEHGLLLAEWEQAHLMQSHVVELEIVGKKEDAEDDVPSVLLVLPELDQAVMALIGVHQ